MMAREHPPFLSFSEGMMSGHVEASGINADAHASRLRAEIAAFVQAKNRTFFAPMAHHPPEYICNAPKPARIFTGTNTRGGLSPPTFPVQMERAPGRTNGASKFDAYSL
jgi:hypothetical protein